MKRYLIPTLAVAAFIFIFDMIFHGFIMSSMYQATKSVWRPEETMESYMPLMWLSEILIGFALVVLYSNQRKNGSLEEGLCFGVAAGFLIGVIQASMYAYLPITGAIAFSWFVGALITGLGAGVICSLVYKD